MGNTTPLQVTMLMASAAPDTGLSDDGGMTTVLGTVIARCQAVEENWECLPINDDVVMPLQDHLVVQLAVILIAWPETLLPWLIRYLNPHR